MTLAGYVRQFRKAIEAATSEMEAASSFQVGSSTTVGVVETFPDKIILRVAGMNRTYPFQDLPIGLAVAIADFKLEQIRPVSLVVKGAYVAVDKRVDSEQLDKAKAWWQEAEERRRSRRFAASADGQLRLRERSRHDGASPAISRSATRTAALARCVLPFFQPTRAKITDLGLLPGRFSLVRHSIHPNSSRCFRLPASCRSPTFRISLS